MADNVMDVNKMNAKPGGKPRVMRDTVWQSRVKKMNYSVGKCMGYFKREASRMVADDMRKTLAEMDDFKNEKSLIERRPHSSLSA